MRITSVSGRVQHQLDEGWELSEGTEPREWLPACVPGTVASALRQLGRWSLETPRSFDASDWWFRCHFTSPTAGDGRRVLCFGGLATLAEVSLNGAPLLTSDNMFVAHEIDVTDRLAPAGGANELVIHFRSLTRALAQKRPRGRWKTRLVAHQQLRWFRTTLLGRVPGWSPAVTAVGPWRAIVLEERRGLEIGPVDLQVSEDGRVTLRARIAAPTGTLIVGDARAELHAEGGFLVGEVQVPDAERWWPHTHGPQPRYPVSLVVEGRTVALGRVAFRSLTAGPIEGEFRIRVNGETIFCRGACWTTPDLVTLRTTPDRLRAELELLCRAGMNMIRVGGTMVYEDDAFYDLCDELGILVWQDFMFANLDYPAADAGFLASVQREVTELLGRLQGRPSLAVVCGGSEIEQQVAMLGLPAEYAESALFKQILPELVERLIPGLQYVPSSPCGGVLPFHPDVGVAHYYGVGAYLRPLEDARRASVRFATECLAFSSIPEQATIDAFLADGESPWHHPRWKERVPRDVGASWDFEDIRDSYVGRLFAIDPARLRYAEMDRYLELGRVAIGTIVAATLAEWRRAASTCKGALVWFWKDLWPGAGWGLLDSLGRPKSPYYMASSVLQPVALLLSDEGLGGPRLHAVNEGPAPVEATVSARLWRQGSIQVAAGQRTISIPARGQIEVHADALFERFFDLSWAYRFGPAGYDALAATMVVGETVVAEAFFWPQGMPVEREADLGLRAVATPRDDGFCLELSAERLAVAVAITLDVGSPDENYLHIEPGRTRRIMLRGVTGAPKGTVKALNGHGSTPIRL